MRLDAFRERPHAVGRERLLRQMQSQMTFRNRQPRVLRQPARGLGSAACADRLPQKIVVPRTGDAVGNCRRHPHLRHEGIEPMDHRRRARGQRGRIEHQHHRGVQPYRHLGGRAGQRKAVLAVEHPHHAFDHGHVRIGGCLREDFEVRLAREHPAIEIVAGPSGSGAMKGRIDEIGTDFESLHAHTAPRQSRHDAGSDRGLPNPAVRPGNYHSWKSHRPGPPFKYSGRPATTRMTCSAISAVH